MKFSQEGEWTVSTPLYIGMGSDVEKAQVCPHREYIEVTRIVEEGALLVQEKCKGCVATRAKFRPATPEEIKAAGSR